LARRIIERMKRCDLQRQDLAKVKYELAKEEGLRDLPKNHEILKYLRKGEEHLVGVLRGKDVRSASGIYTVAVMTKPTRCPKDSPCAYCPGGTESGTPQSYLGNEPALMRGLQANFDPYLQVKLRLGQYATIGHCPSKVQLIIMGGTFPATDLDYQEWFVTRCLQAMNGRRGGETQGWQHLEEAQSRNERSSVRCIGITMETRPDWAGEAQVDRMIRMGATLVEVGVQTLDDAILEGMNRGCGLKQIVDATRVIRDSGLKVGYHIMPGLPGASREHDLETLRTVFEDERFRPDYLKIYPTLVIGGTELHRLWKDGKYEPLSCEDAIDLIATAQQGFPEWVRVARIQRDVPAGIIEGGVRRSNLRELVDREAKRRGTGCRCIRCREVGLAKMRGANLEAIRPEVVVRSYKAGGGTEEFIAAEDAKEDLLVGFLRLRIPSKEAHRPEVQEAAVVRELHIYGQQAPVGGQGRDGFQHQGWGSRLLDSAESIAKERHGLDTVVVLPGVGVRDYYRRRGYRKVPGSNFMRKRL
jgi:elongator complex protein 3